uniref:Peptidase M16 middle/third domain-containing protein n=1 Tax=viral metagenome TaxID=1070528 RepID=A0A6C0KBL4_9ZZZZ
MNSTISAVNGYKLVFIPHKGGEYLVEAVCSHGYDAETPMLTGITELLSRVLLRSSFMQRGNNNLEHSLKSHGIIEMKSGVREHFTWYYIRGDEDINYALEYISSIITNPLITQDCVRAHIDAIKIEAVQRKNNSVIQMQNIVTKTLTPSLAKSIDPATRLDSIDPTKLLNFYNKWYTPDKISIIVYARNTGNVKRHLRKYLKKKNPGMPCIKSVIYKQPRPHVIHLPHMEMVKSRVWLVFSKAFSNSTYNTFYVKLSTRVLRSYLKSILENMECEDSITPYCETVTLKFTCFSEKVTEMIQAVYDIIQKMNISQTEWIDQKRKMLQDLPKRKQIIQRNWRLMEHYTNHNDIVDEDVIIKNMNRTEFNSFFSVFFNFSNIILLHQAPSKLSDRKLLSKVKVLAGTPSPQASQRKKFSWKKFILG